MIEEHPVICDYIMTEDGMYYVGVNIKTEENGKTEKERWLYAVKVLRDAAQQVEENWIDK